MTGRLRLLVALTSLVFFAAHVRTLPRTLEDIDSINFALGVEHFDVASHQPHPPGYPVFIALAKFSTAALGVVVPSWDRDHRAAAGLAVWGLLAGTVAVYVFTEFWIAVGLPPLLAFLAALLAITSPLFWFTAARPLTDTPGLVAAIAVLWWVIRGWRVVRNDPRQPLPRLLVAGAFMAGLIIGLRSQTLWLTGPLLAWVFGELVVGRRVADAAKLVAAAAVGSLVWAVPLVVLSGGFGHYMEALSFQGGKDFSGIEMLWTTPTAKLLKVTLARTFIEPWQPASLAKGLVLLALVGCVQWARKSSREIAIVGVAFLPYLVFHALFQETVTLRYGLPAVVPVGGLAVMAIAALPAAVAAAAAVAVAAVGLVMAQPPLEVYSREGAPVFQAFQAVVRAWPAATPPLVRMHHQVWWGVQRAIVWYRPSLDLGVQPQPGDREFDHESVGLVKHWEDGSAQPVWFLAELSRNDLALFDRRSETESGRFELPASIRALVGGVRLDGLSWWTLRQPAWMLGTGWSVTPEIGGNTRAGALGPHERPAEAFLRRQPGPWRVAIGGRSIAPASGAVMHVKLDGQTVGQWPVSATPSWFVQWIDLPGGVPAGASAYAALTVTVARASGARAPEVRLEQFDAAPGDDVSFAFADDWNEIEGVGRLWRWTSGRSTIEIRGGRGDLTLTLVGESPRKSFDHAPQVVVRAGDRELARFQPSTDFTERVTLPEAALAASGGHVTIETDLTFSPAERGTGSDRRRLGLKLFHVDVK